MSVATAASITRIKGLSQIRRLPRLGKIRLGEKRRSARTGAEYPVELDYFKFDEPDLKRYPRIVEIYGEKPTELDVFFPSDDPEKFFPQAYKVYGRSHGLKCKGDGERAMRALCERCQQMDCGCKDAKRLMVEVTCPCDLLESGECGAKASLMVMLPRISCGGVWQIDTGSYNSIVDINSGIEYVQEICRRIAMVPLKLRRTPRTVHHEGKALLKHTLQVIFDLDLQKVCEIQKSSMPAEYLIERPKDEGDDLPALPAPEEDPQGPQEQAEAETEQPPIETTAKTVTQPESPSGTPFEREAAIREIKAFCGTPARMKEVTGFTPSELNLADNAVLETMLGKVRDLRADMEAEGR